MSKPISYVFALSRLPTRRRNSVNVFVWACLTRQFHYTDRFNHFSGCVLHNLCRLDDVGGEDNCGDSKTFHNGTSDVLYVDMDKLFKCSRNEVDLMIKKCPQLRNTSSISKNIRYLHNQGISKDVVMDNPWILKWKPSTLQFGLKCIKKFHEDVNVSVPLLQIPLPKLRELCSFAQQESKIIPEENRITYLSKKLRCCPSRICKIMASHMFLQRLPFSRLDAVLQLLLDAGVSTENILKDVWALQYNPNTVQERLQRAREAGVKAIKPWIVRCPESVFMNMLQRKVESRILLGKHSSVLSYLSQRLSCDLDDVAYLGLKTPQLLKVNVPKLEEMLDFLYEEGFTPQQVYQSPRILCHSLNTVQSRLVQLRDLGHNPANPLVLCKSKRQYSEFLKKLVSHQTLYL